jgi:hypothetical protein
MLYVYLKILKYHNESVITKIRYHGLLRQVTFGDFPVCFLLHVFECRYKFFQFLAGGFFAFFQI